MKKTVLALSLISAFALSHTPVALANENNEQAQAVEYSATPVSRLLSKQLAQSVLDAGIALPKFREPDNSFLAVFGLEKIDRQETVSVGNVIVDYMSKFKDRQDFMQKQIDYVLYHNAQVFDDRDRTNGNNGLVVQFQPEIIAQNIADVASNFKDLATAQAFVKKFTGEFQYDSRAILMSHLSHNFTATHNAKLRQASDAQNHAIIMQALNKFIDDVKSR